MRLGKFEVLLLLIVVLSSSRIEAQVDIDATVNLDTTRHAFSIKQKIGYINRTSDTLQTFYLNDWANAFKNRKSPLGQHFSSAFIRRFHFSNPRDRGGTTLNFIKNSNEADVHWQRPPEHPDILKLDLDEPVPPGDSIELRLGYSVNIPKAKFTHFGWFGQSYILKHWLIAPAIYRGGWQIYSHQNLNDQFTPLTNINLLLNIPTGYSVYSALTKQEIQSDFVSRQLALTGKNQNNFKIAIVKNRFFDRFPTNNGTVISDIPDDGLTADNRQVTIDRIMNFLKKRLGEYPQDNLMVTQADYKNNKIYGLNQLPNFVRAFPNTFQYDLKMLKTIAHNYLKTSILVNPRKEEWLLNAIEIKLLMDYVDTYYPDTKLIGKLSELIGIRWMHIADLAFNDQYQFLSMNMNRLNLDQGLTVSKDSLVKFNAEIANPYKAGTGFVYLDDFLNDNTVEKSVREFYKIYKMRETEPEDFENILKANTEKDVDWFFKEYVNTNVRIDYTIKDVKPIGDSLQVTIKNKKPNSMPVSLYGLKKDSIVSKYWVEDTRGNSTVTIPRDNITRLGLNYEGKIPEVNQRDNFKKLSGILNRPLQVRPFKDVEDPHYTQFFVIPEFEYNLYDGFSVGPRVSNKAILKKPFSYILSPRYGFRSHALVGSASFLYTQQFRNKNLSSIDYGLSGSRESYDTGLFYYRLAPYIRFNFRHRDLRDRERQSINLRAVSVHRDKGENLDEKEHPNYNVFDASYNYSNRTLANYYSGTADLQVGKKFSKLSLTAKYRRVFWHNRQLEFRFFAGGFLYNHTLEGSDYFSFGLDRPTDYLFDSNLYGRSESSGLFSQQFIESEGAFKSQLEPRYADRWMTTFNASASLWRDWIFLYGDVGALKNHDENLKVRYDSGLRVSLVQDYFEVFFPVYSNAGWEMGKSDYDKRIRFIVTLDLKTLMGLFKRTYY